MDIRAIAKNRNVQTAVLAWAFGTASGVGLGYILGRRKAKREQLRLIIDNTVKEIHDDLDRMRAKRTAQEFMGLTLSSQSEPRIPVQIRDRPLSDILEEEEREQEEPSEEEEAPLLVNVFDNHDDVWDFELEMQNRTRETPYVIHQDEFIADEMGFRQETLTYYAGDDIMADTDDTPIYDYKGLMGELLFGHGTNDKNVVYIRNEVIHMEWEILRHETMFSQEVLGLELEREAEDEIRHSHQIPKFRRE